MTTNNMQRAIETYRRRYDSCNRKNGIFYYNDVRQIREISEAKTKSENLYNSIENALEAGFIVGYLKALEDKDEETNGTT